MKDCFLSSRIVSGSSKDCFFSGGMLFNGYAVIQIEKRHDMLVQKFLHTLVVSHKKHPKTSKGNRVAHQCLQKFGSLQKAALEIWAKCLQSANVAFFLLAGIQGKKFAKKEIPSSFEQAATYSILHSKRGSFQKLVIPARFERATFRLGELVSYFLSISSRSIFCHFTLICQEILRVFLNDRPV